MKTVGDMKLVLSSFDIEGAWNFYQKNNSASNGAEEIDEVFF